MEYVSVQEMSKRWKISKRRIQVLCGEGRVEGASHVGNMWIIPSDASKPVDGRKKTAITESASKKNDSRALLKKNIREALSECNKDSFDKNDSREQIIAVFASVILHKYMPDESFEDQYTLICSDLRVKHRINNNLLKKWRLLAEKLVYEKGIELDNIISWSGQYIGKLTTDDTPLLKTQFFTEQYMADFLIAQSVKDFSSNKIIDPCCGGGNFLTSYLEHAVKTEDITKTTDILRICTHLYGYDIDSNMVNVAFINIKLRAIKLIAENEKPDLTIWEKIRPQLWKSKIPDKYGALEITGNKIVNIVSGEQSSILNALGEADILLTNPPFATTKGMDQELRSFIKSHYPDANSDMCVAFFFVAAALLKKGGTLGIVTQTSWMYLDSFVMFRKKFVQRYGTKMVANLGAGAFQDLSGEKASVALLTALKDVSIDTFKYKDLRSLGYYGKIRELDHLESWETFHTKNVFSPKGESFNFEVTDGLKSILENNVSYSEYAVPMQGTSTGDAKQLIDYYWRHFGDKEWVLVSKGGGYCRWQGLNHYVVKWGKEGEYIKQTKGSAIRNAKYFDETDMVFSDTGTAGLNVRILLPHQIFVASGPGIRVKEGNSYSHLAYLNSRLATCYLKLFSPKLTIAAGYISRLPASEELLTSSLLEGNTRACLEQKRKFLQKRPVNYEYNPGYVNGYHNNVHRMAQDCFIEEIQDELLKLNLEAQIDKEILKILNIPDKEQHHIDRMIGICAYNISEEKTIDCQNLDSMIAKNMDCRCQLRRSRVNKDTFGCDGILEFTSRRLNINPGYLVSVILDNIESFEKTINLYEKMTLHNIMLNSFGFTPLRGIERTEKSRLNIDLLQAQHHLSDQQMNWIKEKFFSYHDEFFYGKGIFKNEPSEV